MSSSNGISLLKWHFDKVQQSRWEYFFLSFSFVQIGNLYEATHTHIHMSEAKGSKKSLFSYNIFVFLLRVYHLVFWVYHDTVLTHLFHGGAHNLLASFSRPFRFHRVQMFVCFCIFLTFSSLPHITFVLSFDFSLPF